MLSRVLVIGGTGKIGRHLVKASLDAGHSTAVLVRPVAAGADPDKARLLEAFMTCGASLVYGDINDREVLVAAIKQADVVISAVGHTSVEEVESQLKIVAAIQEAGHHVKRFLPSEYGIAVELADQMLEPVRSIFRAKLRVREAIRVAGVPHTIIRGNLTQGFLVPRFGNPGAIGTASDTGVITMLGDGEAQAYLVNEKDISVLTIRTMEDQRTLNKTLHVRPPMNLCSLNRLTSIWENKISKTFRKYHVDEEDLVKKVQESPFPLNFQLAIVHAALVVGEAKLREKATASVCAGVVGVEATELYPDMKYITIEECVDGLY